MRIEVGIQRNDDDQGGHWQAWADELHGGGPAVNGGWFHECFITNSSADLRNALWPVLEAAIRRAEQAEIEQLRRRNAELEAAAALTEVQIADGVYRQGYHLVSHHFVEGRCECGQAAAS